MPIQGGAPATIASGVNFPSGVAVDATSVYWTIAEPCVSDGGCPGAVVKVNKSGGTPVTLVSGQNDAIAIAVNATNVYWSDYGGFAQPYNGSINTAAK